METVRPVEMLVQLVEPSAEYCQVPWAEVEALATTTMPAIAWALLLLVPVT